MKMTSPTMVLQNGFLFLLGGKVTLDRRGTWHQRITSVGILLAVMHSGLCMYLDWRIQESQANNPKVYRAPNNILRWSILSRRIIALYLEPVLCIASVGQQKYLDALFTAIDRLDIREGAAASILRINMRLRIVDWTTVTVQLIAIVLCIIVDAGVYWRLYKNAIDLSAVYIVFYWTATYIVQMLRVCYYLLSIAYRLDAFIDVLSTLWGRIIASRSSRLYNNWLALQRSTAH